MKIVLSTKDGNRFEEPVKETGNKPERAILYERFTLIRNQGFFYGKLNSGVHVLYPMNSLLRITLEDD